MTNVHMRIAFMRGAARQYGGTFMSYMSKRTQNSIRSCSRPTHVSMRR